MTGTWASVDSPTHRVAIEVLLNGPISRAELSRRLGLSPGSLTRLTRPLIASGLLVESDRAAPSMRVGRPSQPLDIIDRSHYFIGIKLTADAAYGVLTTLRAQVLHEARLPIDSHDVDAVADVAAAAVTRLRRHVPDGRAVTGIGVTLGGNVAQGEVVRAPYLGWAHVPFGEIVAARTGTAVTVENDVVALTAATHWFGAGRGSQSFALVTIGAGIGFGFVAHGSPVRGAEGGLGVLEHHLLDPGGPVCALGHRGCASAMLTIDSITAQVGVPLHRAVGYDEVLTLSADGDGAARRVVQDAGRALGRLIAAAANFTLTDRVVVGGEGVQLARAAGDVLTAEIAARRVRGAHDLDVSLLSPGFTDWARGAAVHAIQRFVMSA
ncbi:MAG: ROK family transcriptional regulator [Cellulomonadaceae bacterium]